MRAILMRVAGLFALALVGAFVAYGVRHPPKAPPPPAPIAKATEPRKAAVNPIREITPEPAQDVAATPAAPMPSSAETPDGPTQAPAAPGSAMPQAPAPAGAPAAPPAETAAPPPPPTPVATCPGNPNALGVARIIEVDTTGGPGFGNRNFKTIDFLRPGEVVLTFDDGPWPINTPKVLAALARHCTKAIFFPIGLHATYSPDLLKQVAAAGHAVGSHTWCHQNLARTKGRCQTRTKAYTVEYTFKDEIEKGISAVSLALGGPITPFFRSPGLQQPPEVLTYLGKRNVAIFSTDFDSFDFKMRRPEQVRKSVMDGLKRDGKGIILMHDFRHATAEAISQILDDLKAGGYRVVEMRARDQLTSLPEYDAIVMKEIKTNVGSRPTETVVRTIEGQ